MKTLKMLKEMGLLDEQGLKLLEEIEEHCEGNPMKAKLMLCLHQLENLVSKDSPELKTQIMSRIQLAKYLTTRLPNEHSTKEGYQASHQTGVFPLPIEKKQSEDL